MTGALIGWVVGVLVAAAVLVGLATVFSLSGSVVSVLGFILGAAFSFIGLTVGSAFDE